MKIELEYAQYPTDIELKKLERKSRDSGRRFR